MSAHTPGPWELGTPCGLTAVNVVGNNGNTKVASVIDSLLTDCAYGATAPDPEGQANARLIAAAPGLFTFAQEIAMGAHTLDEAADRARELLARIGGAA